MLTCFDEDIEDREFETVEEEGIDRDELERIVSVYISNYFKDKQVPSHVDILSPKYIDMCISTNICDAVDKAYKAMETCGKFGTSSSDHMIAEDIRFVIKTLGQIKKFVPQEYSAGILLMHLEIIEAIPF